jgi:hypothetical protein
MKKILFRVPLLLIAAGCSTLPEQGAETVTLHAKETKPALIEKEENTNTAEAEEKLHKTTISTEVTLLLKEARYYGNGKLDSYTVYSYKENGPLLIREEQVSSVPQRTIRLQKMEFLSERDMLSI